MYIDLWWMYVMYFMMVLCWFDDEFMLIWWWICIGFMMNLCWLYNEFMLVYDEFMSVYDVFMLVSWWMYVAFMTNLCWFYDGFMLVLRWMYIYIYIYYIIHTYHTDIYTQIHPSSFFRSQIHRKVNKYPPMLVLGPRGRWCLSIGTTAT